MKYSIVSCLSTAVLCTSASAANLFVSLSGSGTNCFVSDPCPTIQMAVDNAGAGDTIKVAAGT